MAKDYSLYKFYKGQKLSPYKDTDRFKFWTIESRFDELWDMQNEKEFFTTLAVIGCEDRFIEELIKDGTLQSVGKQKVFDFWLDCWIRANMTDYGECWGLKLYKELQP